MLTFTLLECSGGLVDFDGSQMSLMFLMLLIDAYSVFRSCMLTVTL